MLSREQAQALTRTVHLLRPAWSEEGIYAALAKCKDLDGFEVALAALRAAADKNAKTPGIIPAKGSHWNEPDAAPRTEPRLSREERRKRTCDICGALDGCRPPAHPFVPLNHAANGRVPAEEPTAAALARAQLQSARAHLCPHGIARAKVRCGECERPAPEATTPDPAARSHRPDAQTAQIAEEADE